MASSCNGKHANEHVEGEWSQWFKFPSLKLAFDGGVEGFDRARDHTSALDSYKDLFCYSFLIKSSQLQTSNLQCQFQKIIKMSSTMQKVEQKLGMKSEKGKAHDEKKKAHEERRQKGEDVSDTSSSSESDSGRKYNEEERQRK